MKSEIGTFLARKFAVDLSQIRVDGKLLHLPQIMGMVNIYQQAEDD